MLTAKNILDVFINQERKTSSDRVGFFRGVKTIICGSATPLYENMEVILFDFDYFWTSELNKKTVNVRENPSTNCVALGICRFKFSHPIFWI